MNSHLLVKTSPRNSTKKRFAEAGCKNTPSDLKHFFKWTPDGKPTIVIAHGDNFRWFGYGVTLATFNKHGYDVAVATEKYFVSIQIRRNKHYEYYTDQHVMIDNIIKEQS